MKDDKFVAATTSQTFSAVSMTEKYNPLLYKSTFADPEILSTRSTWNQHTPFAMTLVEILRPKCIVELGTQWGISYFAFCQSVKTLKLECKNYAIDTWEGDDHVGAYTSEVYQHVIKFNEKYAHFSNLLKMRFEDAVEQFAPKSVDILHIDGLHTYEAVKSDFITWLPKMSPQGVVLFHDTQVFRDDFGVHQFWAEITKQYPSFEFHHGFGLGVLLVGGANESMKTLIESANAHLDEMRALFYGLGKAAEIKHLESQNSKPLEKVDRLKRLMAKIFQ